MRLSLQEIARAIHSSLPSLPPLRALEVMGVSTDTRTLAPGDVFIALQGERFDGHDHIRDAFDRGALAAIVNSSRLLAIPPELGILIGVDDPQRALGDIARAWRLRFRIPVIGVTGSVGKTTTKEMLAAALAPLGPVLKTDNNENNEIGVPKLLLRLDQEYHTVVVEMGMRGTGQIKYLAEIAEPTVGVVTVIGENHIELLGSLGAIADAKAELIDSLPPDGLAVLNADDPFTTAIAAKARCRTATFGVQPDSVGATIYAEKIMPSLSGGGYVVSVICNGEPSQMTVPSPARHDISNVLSAVLVAVECGVALPEACAAVESYRNVSMRMEVLNAASGAVILSDCYNASPTSMRSALETLGSYQARRRFAFLGDMRELGDFAPEMHREIASRISDDMAAYAVGEQFGAVMPNAAGRFATSDEAAAFARSSLPLGEGDVILVKGSRAMTMERIVEALTQAS